MARLSRQTREIINTVLMLLGVAAVVVVFFVYPLNRSRAVMGRSAEEVSLDSLAANEPAGYVEKGLPFDTFRVEADGLTSLACLMLIPDSSLYDSLQGTVLLSHGDRDTRDSLRFLADPLVDSGYLVVAVDLRASGRSTGEYFGDGQYESDDLQALVVHLDLRGLIRHPLVLVGFERGAEGSLLAAVEDSRIDGVMAIDPYLSTGRMWDVLKERHSLYWIPFWRTILWWWYNIRSGYAATYREAENQRPVACPTLMMLSEGSSAEEEVEVLKEISAPELLEVKAVPASRDVLIAEVVRFVAQIR